MTCLEGKYFLSSLNNPSTSMLSVALATLFFSEPHILQVDILLFFSHYKRWFTNTLSVNLTSCAVITHLL